MNEKKVKKPKNQQEKRKGEAGGRSSPGTTVGQPE
jgi:hypothetical protein